MPRLRLSLVLLSAALLVVSAAGARPLPGRVVPGEGIGKVRLGMPADAGRKLLKQTGLEFRVRTIGVRPGVRYVEYDYRSDELSAPGYILGVQGASGRAKVVRVAALISANATPQGIRVGATEAELLARYGQQLQCKRVWDRPGGSWACTLGKTSRRHTVFTLVSTDVESVNQVRKITRITVQEPSVRVAL